MTLRRLALCLLAPLLLALVHGQAHAAFKFGSSEKIRFVAATSLQGPGGETLFIGRMVTQRSFGLPYTIEDHGFVLGISGESKRYYPMPQGEQLAALQQAGHLPTPLPAFELDTLDLLFGHLLWITLLCLATYTAYVFARRPRQPAAPNIEPAAWQDTLPPPAVRAPLPPLGVSLPLRLHPSRLKMLGLLAVCLVFVALGLLMSREQPAMGYFCAAFFGLGIPVFSLQMLPGKSYLELAHDRFTTTSLFKRATVQWSDIAELRVIRIHGNKMVGWNYTAAYAGRGTGHAVSSALAGVHGALPDTYGMKAEALAELMDAIRQRCPA